MLVNLGRKSPPSEDLVDLLLECHGRIRSFAQLAVTVGTRDDLSDTDVVDGCVRAERYFTEALPLHVADEEQSLLPRLQSSNPKLDQALAAMQREHTTHEPLIAAMLQAAREVRQTPSDRTRRATLARAATILGDELEAHLRLEEEEIFPHVRALLSPTARAQAVAELRHRRGVP